MAERRLPLSVTDDDGVERRGDLVVTTAWRADLQPTAGAEFAIVLLEEPSARNDAASSASNVAVCTPASPVRLPAAVAEAAIAYGNDRTAPIRLSRAALESYARGRLLAPAGLSITPAQIFSNGEASPRLDLLARALISAGRRTELYWDAVADVLSIGRSPVTGPARMRERLEAELRNTPALPSEAAGAERLARLRQIASGAAPDRVATSPSELAEDAAFLRCLAERPEQAQELAAMRAYLEAITLATETGELAADRAFTREQLSFVSLLTEPHQLAGMRATLDVFRTSYANSYVKHHDAYWRASSRLRIILKDAEPGARALQRLNTLRALGRPVGGEELAAYERLTAGTPACSARNLAAQLSEQPRCPDCGIALGEIVPDEEVESVLRGLRDALARQQARLASEAVRRILARGGERIEQFLQIAQAADQAGLAHVLDDDLLDFLRELLAEPAAPTPEALDLFEELARAHPLVSEEQVDAVVETLRELLTERLAAQPPTDSAPASFRLSSEPTPQS